MSGEPMGVAVNDQEGRRVGRLRTARASSCPDESIPMTVRYSHLTAKHTLAAVERLCGGVADTPTDTKTSTGVSGTGWSVVAFVH